MTFSFFRGNWENENTISLWWASEHRDLAVIKVARSGPTSFVDGQPRLFHLPAAMVADYIKHVFTAVYHDRELPQVQIDASFMPTVMFTVDSVANPSRPPHLRNMIRGWVTLFQHLQVRGTPAVEPVPAASVVEPVPGTTSTAVPDTPAGEWLDAVHADVHGDFDVDVHEN